MYPDERIIRYLACCWKFRQSRVNSMIVFCGFFYVASVRALISKRIHRKSRFTTKANVLSTEVVLLNSPGATGWEILFLSTPKKPIDQNRSCEEIFCENLQDLISPGFCSFDLTIQQGAFGACDAKACAFNWKFRTGFGQCIGNFDVCITE